MRKIKIVALVLAMTTVISVLAGCREKKDNTGNAANGKEESSITSTFDSGKKEGEAKKDAFMQKISSLIDTSKYEFKDWSLEEGYSNSIEYNLGAEYIERYNFDYLINFGDGSSIKLPTTYSEMSKTNWKTETEPDKQISNKVQTGVSYTDSEGNKFVLWTQNFAEGDESFQKLSDCKFYAIDFETRNVPKFNVCGGVTESSTMDDIIVVLGDPSNIDYDIDDDEVTLTFREELTNWYSNIRICLDGQGEKITKIKYEYSYADL